MEPLLYIGIIHAFFVALFMACKQPNRLSDKIIAVWMIFLACPMLSRLGSMIYPDIFLSDVYLIRSFVLTFGPFLWLYTSVLTDKKPTFKKQDLWHFLPFFIFAIGQFFFPEYFVLPSIGGSPASLFQQMHGAATILSLLGYSCVVLWQLKQHTLQVQDHFSCLSSLITLQWLKWLSIGFVIAYMIPLFAPLLELPPFFQKHGVAFTGYIFILSFFALKQPIVFHSVTEADVSDSTSVKQSPQKIEKSVENDLESEESVELKYGRSGLTEERAQEYIRRLESAMLKEKYYLETDLTIEKLAKQIHISRHHLTQVLNEYYNKNFYVYINEYRIKEVQQRLIEPNNADMTILTIAYDSGFNSKSTFNTVFKKITEMTPSQYRKSMVQT